MITRMFLFLAAALPVVAQGQGTPTFSGEIAPIIYDNCGVCHRPGEIGPMPLTSYQEVKNWGAMVKYVTSIRYMPPWKADRNYSSFLGERYLTEEEIQLIADWVDGGMPQGNPAEEPAFPQFPDGSQVGEPDLVLSFSESYTHQGDNRDQYQIFVLPTGLEEDKVLKSIELRPGNTRIVHHALFGLDTMGRARDRDAQTPEYGYEGFGGFGVPLADNFPGYVPGARPRLYPEGIGQRIYAGSDLLIQMHYAPIPADETDSSTVNLFFAGEDEAIDRFVQEHVMLPFGGTLTNGPFVMPAGTVKTFHGRFTVPAKVSLLGIAPHMHLLGQDWLVYAISPEGDTTNLISIPEWDFNWQGVYFFKRFVVLEPGTVVHAYATYDNTADNPLNPNDPPQFVTWGEGTADEMYYLPFLFVPYAPGDEDVVFEEDITTSLEEVQVQAPEHKLYPIFPNPSSSGEITVGFSLAYTTQVSLRLVSMQGQEVRRLLDGVSYAGGHYQEQIPVGGLAAGTYFVQLQTADGRTLSKAYIHR